MSKISISAASFVVSAPLALLIHRITKLSLTSAVKRLSEGRKGIFYSAELFLNDHPQREREILELLDGMRREGVEPFIMEIGPDESWGDVVDWDAQRITETQLRNVLNEAHGRYE
jgi:hypothetical protein